MMMVKAKRAGYFRDIYRWPGDVFRVDTAKEFSEKWMEKVKEPAQKSEAKTTKPSGNSGKAGKSKKKDDAKPAGDNQKSGPNPSSGQSGNETKET